MPTFVWAAIALAVLMIAGSIAMTVPEIPEHVARPAVEGAAQVASGLSSPLGYGLALAMVAAALVYAWRKAK